ncbi:mitochondrial inner membrane protease subunit 2 isoform X2 [Rhinolophus ferrumequinum]|uniref:Inner mitochondrial membrane peptidase subunit 2 n=1 Tax=Rhinolophus ferrumequinum TaxID=59479 RepID=A0A671FUE9_RHIFE|nr:mitochondrial inner membrane protease subunit 2 isoform X2 [Rhinolophus ferrumequinum]
MAQSQGWVKRYFKAFCKGFFVAVPVAVTFLDRVACVARVEGASMQPSLNPGGSQSSDVVLLNHWKVRNFEVQRGDIVSLVSQPTDCIQQVETCHIRLLRFDTPLPVLKIPAFLLDGTWQQHSPYFLITPCIQGQWEHYHQKLQVDKR